MANGNPPVKGVAWTGRINLEDMANPGSFKVNPTIAAGDFKTSGDGGALGNLATTPSASPAASAAVLITLSASEMNYDEVVVQAVDQTATKEWADFTLTIHTTAA